MEAASLSNHAPAPTNRTAGRRAELLDAADRVVRRRGPSASMEDIAAEAGISKPILYRHFGDKGGLFQELFDRYAAELRTELGAALERAPDPRARLAATIDAYLRFVDERREAYAFLMHRALRERPEAHTAVADFVRRVAEEVSRVVREDVGRARGPIEAADPWGHGLVGMVQLAGDWWLEHRTMPRERLVEYLVALLWTGFEGLPARTTGSARPSDAIPG